MWEKMLPWIGGIFAVIGLILIFCDVISGIKRHDKAKTNVVGLILLSISVIGYTITDLILKDSAWPPLASLIWIALFWVYVILDGCLTLGVIKKARKSKKTAATLAQMQQQDLSEQYETDYRLREMVWQQRYADQKVAVEVPTNDMQSNTDKGKKR